MDNWKYDEEEEFLALKEIDDKNAKMIGVAYGTRLISLLLFCPITLILLFSGLTRKGGVSNYPLFITSIIIMLFIFYGMLIVPTFSMNIDEKYKFMVNKPTKRAARECITLTIFFIIISILPTAITKKEISMNTAIPIVFSYLGIYYLSLIIDKVLRKIMDNNRTDSSIYKFANRFSYLLSPITVILYSLAIFSLLPNELWQVLVFYGVIILCSIIYSIINIRLNKNSIPDDKTIDLDEYDLSNIKKYSIFIFIVIGICLIIIVSMLAYLMNSSNDTTATIIDMFIN